MGPLTAITKAMSAGALTPGELQKATGLSRSTVLAALDHLSCIGVLDRKVDYAACSGCQSGTCSSGCSSAAGRGLVTLQLRVRGDERR